MVDALKSLAGGVKGEVLACLAAKSPLSAKEVWREASKNKACTYQGVHKALREFERDGAVERSRTGYSLSRAWVDGLSRELSNYTADKDARKTSFSTAKHGLSATFHAIALLNSLLMAGELKLSREEISLHGHRVAMLPLVMYQVWIDELGKHGSNFVYNSSKSFGVSWYRRLQSHGYLAGSIDEGVRLGLDAISVAGWGRFEVESLAASTKCITMTLNHSSAAAEYREARGVSKKPIDDFMRGCLAGGWRVMMNDPTIECVETQCIACGAPKCVFDVRPRKDFDQKDPRVRSQLKK